MARSLRQRKPVDYSGKKSPAKKPPAKKPPAKKPAKKTPAKKTPAKKRSAKEKCKDKSKVRDRYSKRCRSRRKNRSRDGTLHKRVWHSTRNRKSTLLEMNKYCDEEKGGKILSRKGNYCVKRKPVKRKPVEDPDNVMDLNLGGVRKRRPRTNRSYTQSDRKLRNQK